MPGVRREGASDVAGHLHYAGLINYQRGCISVRDRSVFEQRTDEFYAVVNNECDCLSRPAVLHERGQRQTLSLVCGDRQTLPVAARTVRSRQRLVLHFGGARACRLHKDVRLDR